MTEMGIYYRKSDFTAINRDPKEVDWLNSQVLRDNSASGDTDGSIFEEIIVLMVLQHLPPKIGTGKGDEQKSD